MVIFSARHRPSAARRCAGRPGGAHLTARGNGQGRSACGRPLISFEVQQGRHFVPPVAEEAQIPRLPDRDDTAAGMSGQPSVGRLRGGEQRPLRAQIGVDLLDVARRLGGAHSRGGASASTAPAGSALWTPLAVNTTPIRGPGHRAGFLHLKGGADQRRVVEDVGARSRPAPLPGQRLGLAHGPAQDLSQARARNGVLAEVGQPDHRIGDRDPLREAGRTRVGVVLDAGQVVSPFGECGRWCASHGASAGRAQLIDCPRATGWCDWPAAAR
jgi:hypothetical protein